MAITYHSLGPLDYDGIIEVWKNSGLECKPHGRDSRAKICAQMDLTPDFFIGAFAEDQMIGVVIASSDGRKGWVNRLAIIPGFRGRGIARTLVRKAEEALYQTGIEIINCLILHDNAPSIKLFTSEGYEHWSEVFYFRKVKHRDA